MTHEPQPCACPMQAYAAARMAESVLLGLNGEPNIYECAFVQSDVSVVRAVGRFGRLLRLPWLVPATFACRCVRATLLW